MAETISSSSPSSASRGAESRFPRRSVEMQAVAMIFAALVLYIAVLGPIDAYYTERARIDPAISEAWHCRLVKAVYTPLRLAGFFPGVTEGIILYCNFWYDLLYKPAPVVETINAPAELYHNPAIGVSGG